jgi:uncharacterized protein YlzI (FlbEa/FlbD family)
VEISPDTVITLITGEKLVVLESCEQIVQAVLQFRRQLPPASHIPLSRLFSGAEKEEK